MTLLKHTCILQIEILRLREAKWLDQSSVEGIGGGGLRSQDSNPVLMTKIMDFLLNYIVHLLQKQETDVGSSFVENPQVNATFRLMHLRYLCNVLARVSGSS